MNKEVTLSVAIGPNRNAISTVGSSLGCSFSKPEASSCLTDYDKKIQEAKNVGSVDITMSRAPRKFRIITTDVVSTKITQDLDGTVIVLVNEGLESEIRIPVNADMTKAGVVTDEAVAKALKGEDSNIHFSDIEKLCKIVNNLNQNERTRLNKVIEDAQLAMKRIDSAIAENIKKVETYKRELAVNNGTSVLETGADSSVEIHLHD